MRPRCGQTHMALDKPSVTQDFQPATGSMDRENGHPVPWPQGGASHGRGRSRIVRVDRFTLPVKRMDSVIRAAIPTTPRVVVGEEIYHTAF